MMSVASPLVDNSTAQSAVAAVDLTCTPPYPSGSIEVEVHPGAALTGYTDCTVSNPSSHTEKIEIEVTADGLTVSAPGSITLAAGAEADFQVTVRAESQMRMQSRNLNITATVTETSGVPPPNNADSSANQIINIMQFARMNLEMVTPVVMIEVGSSQNLEYKVSNLGNWNDRFNLVYSEVCGLCDGMEISVPMVSMEIESKAAPSKFRVIIAAPTSGLEWPINSDGKHTMEMEMDVTVSSEFSCNYTSDCLSVTMTQTIIFFQNQIIEPEPEPESNALSSSIDDQLLIYGGSGGAVILLLMLFVVMRRRK